MTVENTFGRWKGRYARFGKRLEMEVASLVDIIHSSCLLHKICELQKNEFMPDWEEVEIFDDAFVVAPINEIKTEDAHDTRAALSNYFIKQFFNIFSKYIKHVHLFSEGQVKKRT